MVKPTAKLVAAGAMFVALVSFGCQGKPGSSSDGPSSPSSFRSIANDYVGAPSSPDIQAYSGVTYAYGVLVISSVGRTARMQLTGTGPASIDTLRFGSNSGPIYTGRDGAYALTELTGSSEARAFCFNASGALSGFALGMDSCSVQFSEDSSRAIVASYGGLTVIDLESGVTLSSRKFFSRVELVPGAEGTLARGDVSGDDGLHRQTVWWNPVQQRAVTATALARIPEDSNLWIDRGHLLMESDGVTDLGPLPGLPGFDSRQETRGYSPWILTRDAAKRKLSVRSIYRGGKQFSFDFAEPILQDTHAFGLYALVICLDQRLVLADLRTGKRVATILGHTDPNGDMAVVLADGTCAGSESAIKRFKLSVAKLNSERVGKVLDDLMSLGPTPQTP